MEGQKKVWTFLVSWLVIEIHVPQATQLNLQTPQLRGRKRVLEKSHDFNVELEHREAGSCPARFWLPENEILCRVGAKLVVWEMVVKLLEARLRVTRLAKEDMSGTVLARALFERSRNVRLRAIVELRKFEGSDTTP